MVALLQTTLMVNINVPQTFGTYLLLSTSPFTSSWQGVSTFVFLLNQLRLHLVMVFKVEKITPNKFSQFYSPYRVFIPGGVSIIPSNFNQSSPFTDRWDLETGAQSSHVKHLKLAACELKTFLKSIDFVDTFSLFLPNLFV